VRKSYAGWAPTPVETQADALELCDVACPRCGVWIVVIDSKYTTCDCGSTFWGTRIAGGVLRIQIEVKEASE
jgi:hypothetical protein